MGTFLNRGNQSFARAVHSKIYVDKTDMLAILNNKVNTEQSYVCVSRPRRFGKSIAANMVAAYYDKSCDSQYLFKNRKIASVNHWDRYLNKFAVITIDVADVRSRMKDPQKTLQFINDELYNDLQEAYPSCVLDRELGAATWLDKINEANNEQFVIIIDEWDCLFRDFKDDLKAQAEYIDLLRSLFKGNAAKKFLALAYITGILPIKRYNSESALNNFYEYTMLQPDMFAQYIGFTTNEVEKLCCEYEMDYTKALEWYDGYAVGKEQHVCGPNSIIRALDAGVFRSYWTSTVAFESLKDYITMDFDGLKEAVKLMLSGQKVKVNTMGYQNDMVSLYDKNDVLTLLIHLGYLAYDEKNQEAYIPNREVREYFDATIERTSWNELINTINASENLLKATLAMDEEAVESAVDECHVANTSILNYNDENALACCIALAYYAASKEYDVFRELPAGYGFADMVFVPKKGVAKPAMIVELKWNETAETAITQMLAKEYVSGLASYRGDVLLVGISYSKKGLNAKKHRCIIKKIIKE